MDARDIYQANLDAVSRALLTRDLGLMMQHIAVPGRMSLRDARLDHETPDVLKQALNDFRDTLGAMGITDYHRICIEAAFTDAAKTRIEGRHETHALKGSAYLFPAYDSVMRLRLEEDGNWKGYDIMSNTRNSDTTILSPSLLQQKGSADG